VVHTGLAALITCIGSEIKHIPKMSRPHKGTLIKELQHILVVLALIFLCLVASVRMRGVKVWHTLAAILGIAEATVRISLMEVIYPKVVKPHKGSVPAEVEIPAYHV
jgi:hypothetical protein